MPGAQLAQEHVLVAQPRGEARHELGRRRGVDDVLAGGTLAHRGVGQAERDRELADRRGPPRPRTWCSATAAVVVSSAGEPHATSLAVVDDRDAVAEVLGFVHRVGGEHDGARRRRAARGSSPTSSRARAGSMPAVGSSRNTSVGRPTSESASERRCC